MLKYRIEGNINFKEELNKMLELDDNNEINNEDNDNLCKITGQPLIDKYVELECSHKFNYEPLYTEIYTQKHKLRTYNEILNLSINDNKKIRNSNLDYFIKCPYCRNIQFTILPYYEELGLNTYYGINSLDKSLQVPNLQLIDFHYGVTFKLTGKSCCKIVNENGHKCKMINVANIKDTDLSYCKFHFKEGLKKYKFELKQKIIDDKKKEAQDKLIEVNEERVAKGLTPLKRLIKKKIANIVEKSIQEIPLYVPEIDTNANTNNDAIFCKAILKSGPNKGKVCSNKKVNNGLCKRHSKII
jgi:hypothetical protein